MLKTTNTHQVIRRRIVMNSNYSNRFIDAIGFSLILIHLEPGAIGGGDGFDDGQYDPRYNDPNFEGI